MALVGSLTIYNDTRKLIEDYMCVYEKIRVLHRHYIGKYIYDNMLKLPMFIILANRSVEDKRERIHQIEGYLCNLECVSIGVRIAGEAKVISIEDHNRLSEQIRNLSKQANAWNRKTASIPDTNTVREETPLIKGCPVDTACQTTYE